MSGKGQVPEVFQPDKKSPAAHPGTENPKTSAGGELHSKLYRVNHVGFQCTDCAKYQKECEQYACLEEEADPPDQFHTFTCFFLKLGTFVSKTIIQLFGVVKLKNNFLSKFELTKTTTRCIMEKEGTKGGRQDVCRAVEGAA